MNEKDGTVSVIESQTDKVIDTLASEVIREASKSVATEADYMSPAARRFIISRYLMIT